MNYENYRLLDGYLTGLKDKHEIGFGKGAIEFFKSTVSSKDSMQNSLENRRKKFNNECITAIRSTGFSTEGIFTEIDASWDEYYKKFVPLFESFMEDKDVAKYLDWISKGLGLGHGVESAMDTKEFIQIWNNYIECVLEKIRCFTDKQVKKSA